MNWQGRDRSACQRLWPTLAILVCLSAAQAYPGVSLDAQRQIVTALEHDPMTDPYRDLKPNLKQAWTKDSDTSINETIRQLLATPVPVTIEVKLVGFDGSGFAGMHVRDSDMRSYLHALRTDMDTVVLEPHLAALSVYPQFNWLVSHDNSRLGQTLEVAVKNEALHANAHAARQNEAHKETAGLEPLGIYYKPIDDIIGRENRNHNAHLTIYILNLNTGLGKYVYRYMDGDLENQHHCWGTHYVSSARTSTPRYMWWDITAGPISYGPGLRNKGHVFEHVMPHPKHFKPEALPQALMPHLAATVWSAVQHLVWPPLQHSDVHFKTHVIIQVIHMHERLSHANDKFNRAIIEEALRGMLGGQQILEVHETWLPLSSCPMCTEAYTSSLKVRNAREEGSTMLMTSMSKVLDPVTMHRLMVRYQDGIYGHAGVGFEVMPQHKVLPVFVWDVKGDHDPVLFLGGHQAVAFSDMVLAVSSRVGPYTTAATCGSSSMMADSYDVTRPVLAAVLQAGWGLANISTYYSPATGVGASHMWALTNTPFGPLTTSPHVSAPVAALAARNMALAHLNTTSSRLITLLAGFAKLSRNGKFDSYAAGEHRDRVIARVNLAKFKLQQAVAYMGQTDYWRGLMYARSLDHDVQQLDRMALKIAQKSRPALKCRAGPTLASVWWAPVAAAATWVIAMFLRSRIYTKKLDKVA